LNQVLASIMSTSSREESRNEDEQELDKEEEDEDDDDDDDDEDEDEDEELSTTTEDEYRKESNEGSSSEESSDDEESSNRPPKKMRYTFRHDRNKIVQGKVAKEKHTLERNMAAQGIYANRDITRLTTMVSTSPRLKAVLDKNLKNWEPRFPLLVSREGCLWSRNVNTTNVY